MGAREGREMKETWSLLSRESVATGRESITYSCITDSKTRPHENLRTGGRVEEEGREMEGRGAGDVLWGSRHSREGTSSLDVGCGVSVDGLSSLSSI